MFKILSVTPVHWLIRTPPVISQCLSLQSTSRGTTSRWSIPFPNFWGAAICRRDRDLDFLMHFRTFNDEMLHGSFFVCKGYVHEVEHGSDKAIRCNKHHICTSPKGTCWTWICRFCVGSICVATRAWTYPTIYLVFLRGHHGFCVSRKNIGFNSPVTTIFK